MPALLIIRPEGRAEKERQICAQAGWRPLLLSPIEVVADTAALAALPQQLAQADAVFWVSPSAVETAAPVLKAVIAEQSRFSDDLPPQITVGKASSKALAAYITDEIHCPEEGNDSEAVLRLPLWQRLPKGATVLIVRGQGGRNLLADTLRAQGFRVEFAEIYRRENRQLNWQNFDTADIAAAYITSVGQVEALFAQIPPPLARFFKNLLYFTHHPRIADALAQAGAEQIKVVAALDAAALQTVRHGANMSSSENLPENKRPDSSAAVQKPSEKPDNPPAEAAKQGNTMSKQEQPVQAAQPVVIRQSSGKGLAAGALVLAILGLGASGFLFVQGQNVLKNQELAFSQKISNAALGESENAALLKDNLNRQTVIQAELARLGDGQKANGEQIAQARAAYQELVKGRVNWLVDEAETMINIAAQQLQLSGNVQGAVGVLEHINERLSRFDQPDLLPIKQAVSNDLAALKNRPYVDISGTALRLDRLETAVAGLPLMVDGVLKPGAAEPAVANNAVSWWENAWQKSWDAVKNLVEIRHLDNNDAMLLAPEQIYFIRENLRLRLLDARTALLQQNGEVFQSDLNNVEATVKQYFDKNSPATQSWLKEIAELKNLDVRTVADDALKASLAAVHNYQDDVKMRRSAAQAEALPEEQAASETAASAPAASGETAENAKNGVEAPQLPSEKKASEAAPAKAPKAEAVKGEKA